MKKLLSLILALMLLTLPAIAMAEDSVGLIGGADGQTQIVVANNTVKPRFANAIEAGRRVNQTITLTELTGVKTGDAMTDAAIADLVEAFGIDFVSQGDEINMALTLSGKDVVTLGGALSGEDVYLSSNMMGGTVVVGLDEVEPLVNRILDAMVTMGAIGEEEAAMLRESLTAFKSEIDAAMQEEKLEDMVIDEMDFSALEAILPMLMGKITQAENIIVPRMCDPAVSGLQLVLTNEDIHAVLKQSFQFMLDNPMLLESLAESTGAPTEAQLEAQWETAGQLYMTFGIYESKEAFMASQETVESNLREGMNELASVKILGGDVVVNVYLDEQDQPVYITGTMPILTEDTLTENPENMITTTVNLTYTRQTVPQGVAHVCNISVEDVTVTIDALVGEGSTVVNVTAAEPECEPAKLFELSIKEAASEINPGVTCIDVDAVLYDGADTAAAAVSYDGEYEYTDVREYCKGKLVLTAYEDVYTDAAEWHTFEHDIVLDFSTDTVFTGVDYTTDASFTVEAGGVRFGMKLVEETTDPEPSIMTGNVVRPAELNDADFSNWFTGVINAFNAWLAGAFQSLPESVLMLMIYSGMM